MERSSIFTTFKKRRKKMKKTLVTLLAAGLITVASKAQTIQEGMNHLYADRFKSASSVFEKMIAANPNNAEAIYWLGQVYFDMDDNAKTRQLYQKAMDASGSQPLILVGLGHADLMDNKPGDARTKFDAALIASNTKKGPDPIVQTAIGRANVDAKGGDYNYAVQQLEAAHLKDSKNTETILQLGNAYRKQGEGSGGGRAFETYKKAFEVNPAFAVADLRLAKMFETQKNFELVLEYLNSASKRDAKFAPAYYELFYYYFFRRKYTEAEEQLNKYVASTDANWETDYLQAQLCYAKKDYNCAITKGEAVAAVNGENTKPRVLRSLALSYYENNDIANAKKNIDKYFSKDKDPDKFSYELLLKILLKSGGTPDEIVNAYKKGAAVDTVLADKIDFLKQGIAYFKEQKMRDKEAILIQEIIPLRKTPLINDYYDLTVAHFNVPDYAKSRDAALLMRDKWADQMYGYDWAINNSRIVDTVKKDSILVPDLLKMETFAFTDTVKYKKQYLNTIKLLADYYYTTAKDKAKSVEYFKKWQVVDAPNFGTIDGYIKAAESLKPKGSASPPPPTKTPPATKPKTTATKPAAKPPVAKKPVISKPVAKK
jgi:Tfp pilus assembly protein PilF